ncbi:MAG: signal peptidase I [Clostridia bacterium]|nr:signal peptidase I [Clostridia bacterium]
MNRDKKYVRQACEKLHAKDSGYRSASNIDLLIFIAGLLVTLLAVRAFIFEPVRVDGESMLNTLQDGERCIVEKVSYWVTSPKSGDIVIVHYPGRGNESFVKRVIATGGQTIELKKEGNTKGQAEYYVVVDGERLDDSAYRDTMLFDGVFYSPWLIDGSAGPYTVPEGYVFVMGDHRTNSHDSRASSVGPIPLSDVVGRVHGVLYPINRIRKVD